MDEYVDVLEVQSGDDSGGDIHRRAEQQSLLTHSDLSRLRLTDLEQVQAILDEYEALNIPHEHVEMFKAHLLARNDSWFIQAGEVGLIYLTSILPSFSANFNVVFWDGKFGRNRREMCQVVLATAFKEFALTRVASFVPVTNKPLAFTEMKKIGFVLEGTLRKAWREVEDHDLLVFGLLSTEVKFWPVVPSLQIEARM